MRATRPPLRETEGRRFFQVGATHPNPESDHRGVVAPPALRLANRLTYQFTSVRTLRASNGIRLSARTNMIFMANPSSISISLLHPNFGIRFNGMRLQIERRNHRPSIIDFGVSCRRAKIQRRRLLRDPFHERVTRADRPHRPCFVSQPRGALSAHWPQPGGMQTVIFIADSTKNTYTLPG